MNRDLHNSSALSTSVRANGVCSSQASGGLMKILIYAFAALLAAVPASAAHPVQVEDMQQLSRLGSARISPDGRWVAFTVTESELPKNRSVANPWSVPAAGGDARQLTFADHGSNNSPRWSPDSQYLYFASTRADSKSQIFRLAIGGGEARQITSVPTGVGDYFLSPDGKTIAFVASVYPQCTDMACNEKMAKAHDDDP